MPVQITYDFGDAGVLVGFSYRTYSVPRELGDDDCERVLYSLQIFDVGVRYNKE